MDGLAVVIDGYIHGCGYMQLSSQRAGLCWR